MRLTTKKKTGSRGLAAIASGNPGYEIKLDGAIIGAISQHKSLFSSDKIPFTNTSSREIDTWEAARDEAFALIRKALQ